MKRSIIALMAAMSILGMAGAGISSWSSEGSKSPMLSMNTAPRPPVDRPSEPRPNIVAKSAPADLPKASPEPQQAPVPLLVRPRQAAKPSTADAPEAPATSEPTAAAPPNGPDPAGENAARAAIEADGYKNVRILTKGDGVWRAKALRGKTEVLLIVDSNGSVTTAE